MKKGESTNFDNTPIILLRSTGEYSLNIMKITKYNNNLVIQKRTEIYFLSFTDILYIERFGNLTIVHTTDDEISIRFALNRIIELLPPFFLRSHKSYILNTTRIKQMRILGKDSATYEAFFNNEKSALITKDKISILFD